MKAALPENSVWTAGEAAGNSKIPINVANGDAAANNNSQNDSVRLTDCCKIDGMGFDEQQNIEAAGAGETRRRNSEVTVVLSDYNSDTSSSSSSGSGSDEESSSGAESAQETGETATTATAIEEPQEEDQNPDLKQDAAEEAQATTMAPTIGNVSVTEPLPPKVENIEEVDRTDDNMDVSEPVDDIKPATMIVEHEDSNNGNVNEVSLNDSTNSGASDESEHPDSEGLLRLNTKWGCFGQSEKVFAYWKGPTTFSTGYYPGVIVQKGVLNVYQILFDDETECNTSEVQIIPVLVLGVGVKVFYSPEDHTGGPLSAQIVGQKKMEDGEYQYALKVFGSDTVTVCPRRHFYLTVNEGKDLRKKYEAVQPKFGDVNLDNVVSGPRQRPCAQPASSTPVLTSESPADSRRRKSETAATATAPKKARNSAGAVKHDSPSKIKKVNRNHIVTYPCVKNFKVPGKSKPHPNLPELKPISKEKAIKAYLTGFGLKVRAPKSQVGGKKTEASKKKISNTAQNLKTLNKMTITDAKPKSGIFTGYYFYMTAGDRTQLKGIEMGKYEKDLPKSEMSDMILNNGGTELRSVGEDKGKNRSKVFLLASSHLRTLKYLYCIAAGIPCVAQRWIKDSVMKGAVQDWKAYRLSPGWNVKQNRLTVPHSHFPLEGMRIGLATFKDDVIGTWKCLIPAAKGKLLVSKTFNPNTQPAELSIPPDWLEGSIDILVSDFFCPKAIKDKLKEKKIPVVRVEWLVETITIGEIADYCVGEMSPVKNKSFGKTIG